MGSYPSRARRSARAKARDAAHSQDVDTTILYNRRHKVRPTIYDTMPVESQVETCTNAPIEDLPQYTV